MEIGLSLFSGKEPTANEPATRPTAARHSPSNLKQPGAAPAPDHPEPRASSPRTKGANVAAIGSTVVFSGELSGDEDLEILGQVKGKIELPSHQLIVGEGGRVEAEVKAKCVLVLGRVSGNVEASERLEIQASGIVEGDVRAPRLLIQEGAIVNGHIEMTKAPEASKRPVVTPVAPTPVAAPSNS